MKRASANHRSVYLVGLVLPIGIVILLLVLGAIKPTKNTSNINAQRPQGYLPIPSPVGTQPVLPTLPPLPPVPSAGPSAIASVPPTAGQATAVSTIAVHSQENPVQLLRQATFGSWSYMAKRVGNEPPTASVRVDTKSVASLRAFIAANQQYATQLSAAGGTSIVRVIFRQAMDPDAYRSWAKGSGITSFDMVCLAATDLSGGPRGALCLYPGSSDPLPEAAFAQAKKGLQTVQGVSFLKGTMSSNLLQTLALDPQILILDLTDNIVQHDLSAAGIADAANVVVSNDMPVFKVMDLLNQGK